MHSVVVQRRFICDSIRFEGADRVGIRLFRKLCVLDLGWRDILHLHATVVLHLLAAICWRALLLLIEGLFHFWWSVLHRLIVTNFIGFFCVAVWLVLSSIVLFLWWALSRSPLQLLVLRDKALVMWMAMKDCGTIANSIWMKEVCRNHPLLILILLAVNDRFIYDNSFIRSVKSILRILTWLLHEMGLLNSEARVWYSSLCDVLAIALYNLSLRWVSLNGGHLRILSLYWKSLVVDVIEKVANFVLLVEWHHRLLLLNTCHLLLCRWDIVERLISRYHVDQKTTASSLAWVTFKLRVIWGRWDYDLVLLVSTIRCAFFMLRYLAVSFRIHLFFLIYHHLNVSLISFVRIRNVLLIYVVTTKTSSILMSSNTFHRIVLP